MTLSLTELSKLTGSLRLDRQIARVQQTLNNTPGVKMESAFAGKYQVGAHMGDLNIAALDLLRVTFAVRSKAMSAIAALELTHQLPGNLRMAIDHNGRAAIEDIRIDHGVQLAETFAVHDVGVRLALRGKTRKRQPARAPSRDEVDAALAATRLEEEAIVRLESGWQLHPKLAGEPLAVEAKIEADSLRVWRVLLAKLPGESILAAAADQALRYNARLRQCRLASTTTQLVAEARLHTATLTPPALEAAVRAVAVADRHCRATLQILATQAEVAKEYRKVLLGEE